MANLKSKRAIAIQDAIRQVLVRDWDPISVRGNANLEDEYDAYIAPVYRILSSTRSEYELVDFLLRTEHNTIELHCDSPDRLRPIARRLLELDVAI